MIKPVVLTATITVSLLLIGITNLNSIKLQPAKPEIHPDNVLKPDSIKIYQPQIISPSCPSSEYQLSQAQSQTVGVTTLHCSKCSLGALYEKDGKMICTYCNN